MVRFSPRLALLAASFGLCYSSFAAAQSYSYASIIVPNSVYTSTVAINAGGTVLGTWYDNTFTEHGFLYQGGSVTSIDYPGAANGTLPAAFNAKGEVVGGYYDASYVEHGFTMVMKKGKPVFTNVDAPGSAGTTLTAIANAGTIFGGGVGADNAQYVFSKKASTFTTIIGAGDPAIYGASDNGNLAGAYFVSYPPTAWVYVKGTLVNLPTTGQTSTVAYCVNSKGVAVGSTTSSASVTSGFTFAKGKLKTVAVPGAVSSSFTGINDAGTIVGTAYDSTNNLSSFVDSAGTFTTLAVPGGADTSAYKINDAGQVIGTYTDANGNQDGFLASPAN